MKILYFYQYFGTPKGSWSSRVYELTRRWVIAGHEVTVITAPYYKSDIKASGFISKQEIEGIKLIVINSGDSNKAGTLTRAINAIVFSIVSAYYALTIPANVVIASSGPITIAFPALVAKWIRKIPMVFEVRDLWPRGGIELGKLKNPAIIKLSLWFEKLCYNNASLIIPCSTGMESGIKQVNLDAKTLVIPNASDNDLFNISTTYPENIPFDISGKSVYLYAGSLGFMDECGQIIRGMNQVKDKNIFLVLAGDGAEKKELEKLAKETGNSNIYFLGLLPKTEIIKWYSIAIASFVTFKDYPVLHTSSPNKLFDSFASGVPVIQSTKGWIKQLIDKENCGINVNPNSSKEFADAMILLSKDKYLQREMGSNARKLAQTDFNRDFLSQKYLNAITELDEKKPSV